MTKIAGFLKARNEIIKEGNIYRALRNLEATCDCGIVCDDASTDGTGELLEDFVKAHQNWILLRVEPGEQDFGKELLWKQRMLEEVHAHIKPDWIWWLDADEVLDAVGTQKFRSWVEGLRDHPAYRFHYTNLWRHTNWARTDDGFDDGFFIKLWRYSPELSFDTPDGTHHAQFPRQIDPSACGVAPFDVIHYGNVGKNLVWKGIQYSGGRGGVDRHIAFGHEPSESLATGQGYDLPKYSKPCPVYREVLPTALPPMAERKPGPPPEPFSLDHIKRIRSLRDMRGLEKTFAVVLPTYNRGKDLPKGLDSLIAQTYDKWVCFVLDDGSTDDTPVVMERYQALDPRIFYARYPHNRGGVAMNEIGMALAVESCEWWSRLGSDDWFGPRKLELDAAALEKHEACYGLYTVVREGRFEEVCNPPMDPEEISKALLAGRYLVSWANIAARTSALKRVRDKFGEFALAGTKNMEDFAVVARMSALGIRFHWRGTVDVPNVPIGTAWDSSVIAPELEAIWTAAASGGASSPENNAIYNRDELAVRQMIAKLSLEP